MPGLRRPLPAAGLPAARLRHSDGSRVCHSGGSFHSDGSRVGRSGGSFHSDGSRVGHFARALALVVAPVLALLPGPARADVIASPCDVEHFEKYLGERCLMCESSEYEPERCRDAYAGAGLRQRCTGMPLGSTMGFSMWGELWCLPPEKKDAALPEALPPIERVADTNDPFPGLPPIPAGFKDAAALPPEAPSEAEAAAVAAVAEAPPTASAPPAKAPESKRGCSCRVEGEDAGEVILLGVFVVVASRRRRGRA